MTRIKEYVLLSERKDFLLLVNEIYKRNSTKFTSPEDVFQIFIKATFTGKILDIARLIGNTFGKGSFKQLAKTTWLPNKFLK